MAWTALRTWTVGEMVTASLLNAQVRDNLLETETAKVTTAGDVPYATGANAVGRLAIGTATQRMHVASGIPAWRAHCALWWIDIEPLSGGDSNTGWSTVSSDDLLLYGGELASGGAQNDEVTFPIYLFAGTWTFRLTHRMRSNEGIYSIQLDGVEVGTIDGYAAGPTPNSITDVTGIIVATSGKKTLKLKMATKNASSSSYRGDIAHITWFRTA